MKRLTAKELNRIKTYYNMDGEDIGGAYRVKDGHTYVKNFHIEQLVNEVEALQLEIQELR